MEVTDAAAALPHLLKPGTYQRLNAHVFRTPVALRYYLDNRRENGLLECRGVVETPMGLRIDPERFAWWALGRVFEPETDTPGEGPCGG
jgi:hypothetical protein